VTTIAFRLHDGRQTKVEFNYTHKVADLYRYVDSVAPKSGYVLLNFRTPLDDESLTLEEAKVLKAMVTQSLI
jgi:hypothetical protein